MWPCVAGACHPDSQIILQFNGVVSQGLASKGDIYFESIWFKAFLSPQRTNVTHGNLFTLDEALQLGKFFIY